MAQVHDGFAMAIGSALYERFDQVVGRQLRQHFAIDIEALEALRWARELIATGRARPEEIAIAAASPEEWDDHFLALGDMSDLDLHFIPPSTRARARARETADPVSQTGDLWTLGKNRLLCGDSTAATDVERVLGGVEPHLMVTDPPYGVEYDASQ
jgi:hypothetical protein